MVKNDYYLDSGYLNIEKIEKKYNPYTTIIIGGRGIGKTYGFLKYLLDNEMLFILVRRTLTEREYIRNVKFNPLNVFFPDQLKIETGKYTDSYFVDDKLLCLCVNLTTSSKIRGIDGSMIQAIFYDEFIPEMSEKKMINEATAIFQLYETVNRNREIAGKEPVKLYFTANSNNIFNDIMDSLHLADVIFDMREKQQDFKYIKKKKLFLADVKKSPISEKKKNTYLYTLTKDTEFYNMAINNNFSNDYKDFLGLPYQLKEYKPFVDIGEIHILKHCNIPLLYVTFKNRGTAKKRYYNIVDFFKEYNIYLSQHFIRRSIFFECSALAQQFKDFFI